MDDGDEDGAAAPTEVFSTLTLLGLFSHGDANIANIVSAVGNGTSRRTGASADDSAREAEQTKQQEKEEEKEEAVKKAQEEGEKAQTRNFQ